MSERRVRRGGRYWLQCTEFMRRAIHHAPVRVCGTLLALLFLEFMRLFQSISDSNYNAILYYNSPRRLYPL